MTTTQKLHVQRNDAWLPVFCYTDGRVITCEDHPEKALPAEAMWAADDLKFFPSKFGNDVFALRDLPERPMFTIKRTTTYTQVIDVYADTPEAALAQAKGMTQDDEDGWQTCDNRTTYQEPVRF